MKPGDPRRNKPGVPVSGPLRILECEGVAEQMARQTLLAPIAYIPGVEGRKTVKIEDCGESLVPLSGFAPSSIAIRPEYALRGYRAAIHEVFVRERVARMLLDAARLLPRPYRLLIWDAWRPIALQEEFFAEQRERLRRQHPEYHEDHLIRETESYVSFPSRDPKSPAPHSTGGAVDLTICDETGQPVPMGTGFDHFGPEAATRYFEEHLERGERLNEEEHEALFNRRLLYGVMTAQAFTNYRKEWWHFDFGDQFWGLIMGGTSIYGGRDTFD